MKLPTCGPWLPQPDLGFIQKSAITGEHGVGLAKKDFLPKFAGNAQMRVMRELRRSLDLDGILNPGKMFD